MTRVTIAVQPRPYDAIIEDGLLERAGQQLRGFMGNRQQLFVVTVPPVRRRWGKKLLTSFSAAGFNARLVEMRDGERSKKLATIEELAERLTRLGADRNAVIVAFGGGVVGDVAGLLASLYMRGVDVVQIPTTVQAQLDAAIGGKTGVIGKPELFTSLEKGRANDVHRDPAMLEWVLAESVRLKAAVVSSDERESGLRRVLNFGHTIGHALEAESGYRHFLHGEAVAWGMIAATHIAVMT